MKEQQMNLLDEMGFNTKSKGCQFFLSVSEDVIDLIDKIEHPEERNDIRDFDPKTTEELKEKFPSLYLEEYAFSIECGKTKYFENINNFLNSIKTSGEKATKLYNEVFGHNSEDLDDMLYSFSMYTYRMIKEEKKSKVLCKEIGEM